MVHEPRAMPRWTEGRADDPTAVILDSRTVQSTPESGVRGGYDGHKKRKGSKIHLAVDTLRHLQAPRITPANAQDRALSTSCRGVHPLDSGTIRLDSAWRSSRAPEWRRVSIWRDRCPMPDTISRRIGLIMSSLNDRSSWSTRYSPSSRRCETRRHGRWTGRSRVRSR